MLGKTLFRSSLLLLALALLVSGCGFKLRGQIALPPSIGPVYIQGLGPYDELRRELVQLLKFNDIKTVDTPQSANSTLQILERSSDRRVISVDGSGDVAEYELHEGVSFSLVGRDSQVLVKPQSIDAVTTYLNPEIEVLGKQQEERQLRKNIQRDLAARIMRRLQAQL